MRNNLNRLIRLLAFIALALIAIELYHYLFFRLFRGWAYLLLFIPIWILSAYIVLPRIYRGLTKVLLPDYFIGRTRTGDGLLGDPVNLALNGDEAEIVRTMKAAGWVRATPLNLKSSFKMAYTSITASSYPDAPVSPLFLFSRQQDLAFELDDHGKPRQRHHVRFWKTPSDWWLPGGRKADWLGAATFDKNVGLSLFTGQITHKIDADIDKERDFVVESLRKADPEVKIKFAEHFMTSFHGRNGGGDRIETDGALPFIHLS
jgi:hypothetical protein